MHFANYTVPMNTSSLVYQLIRRSHRIAAICIISLALVGVSAMAQANAPLIFGVIDSPLPAGSKSNANALISQVRTEQQALAKGSEQALLVRAEQGERLAQVVMGGNFAAEAQMLTFAPMAANAANSDALKWYELAAKRGFPGAPALDQSGVSFYPVRAVRSR